LYLRKKIHEKHQEIGKECNNQEVVIQGFVRFIEDPSLYLEMEGGIWEPAIICDHRFASTKALGSYSWSLAYFRKDGFMIPKNLCENAVQSANFYSEVVSTSFDMQFAKKNCFLKVRAAAIIPSMSTNN
ncbi:MAG TPA: hypothetical protein VHL11_08670, partial [Phototrophicaceae bacterium]|nr:hypothetical protein [Phototrophicaceae bacterium]